MNLTEPVTEKEQEELVSKQRRSLIITGSIITCLNRIENQFKRSNVKKKCDGEIERCT